MLGRRLQKSEGFRASLHWKYVLEFLRSFGKISPLCSTSKAESKAWLSESRQSLFPRCWKRKRWRKNWMRDPVLQICKSAFGALVAIGKEGEASCSPPTVGAAPSFSSTYLQLHLKLQSPWFCSSLAQAELSEGHEHVAAPEQCTNSATYFCLYLQTVQHPGVIKKWLADTEVLNWWPPKPLEWTTQSVLSDNVLSWCC